MKLSIPGQARTLHCTYILCESRRDGWFTYCASVSVCVHRTRHVVYQSFWQDSVRSVLPSVVVHTTRRNGLFVNERFVSGPRRNEPTTSCRCCRRCRLSKVSTQRMEYVTTLLSSLIMEFRISTERSISREPATTTTARHRCFYS
jgi:hypothetical protein